MVLWRSFNWKRESFVIIIYIILHDKRLTIRTLLTMFDILYAINCLLLCSNVTLVPLNRINDSQTLSCGSNQVYDTSEFRTSAVIDVSINNNKKMFLTPLALPVYFSFGVIVRWLNYYGIISFSESRAIRVSSYLGGKLTETKHDTLFTKIDTPGFEIWHFRYKFYYKTTHHPFPQKNS